MVDYNVDIKRAGQLQEEITCRLVELAVLVERYYGVEECGDEPPEKAPAYSEDDPGMHEKVCKVAVVVVEAAVNLLDLVEPEIESYCFHSGPIGGWGLFDGFDE